SARPHVLDFLEARTRRLRDLGLDPSKIEALIPNESGACYSEAGWRRRRAKTFAEAGIERANFRVLRPSFAQRLKDRGAPIEAVPIDRVQLNVTSKNRGPKPVAPRRTSTRARFD